MQVGVVALRLLLFVADTRLRSRYRQQLSHIFVARWREPHILFTYALKVAAERTHYTIQLWPGHYWKASALGTCYQMQDVPLRVKRRVEVRVAA